MSMEGFNEGMYGDREVHAVEMHGDDRCIIEIANYRFTYVRGKDDEVYLVGREKPGSHSPDLEDIPQVFLDRGQKVAEKVFAENEMQRRNEQAELRQDLEEREILHTEGEEILEEKKKELD